MELCFPLLFVLIPLIVVFCMESVHASLLPKLYWESKLPNTEIPKALNDLLRSDSLTSLKSHNGKPLPLQLQPDGLNYGYISSNLAHDPNFNITSLFFLDKNLSVGTKLNLHFPKTSTTKSPFLIREVAETYPFSSKQLPEILVKFSMKPNTTEANLIENTIKDCEVPSIKGEEAYCTTSLESMVDLGTIKMGKEVTAISTVVEEEKNFYWQVSSVVKKSSKDKALVCHKKTYPYAVFYCHSTESSRVYKVDLTSTNRRSFSIIAVCHNDTSAWNPKHLAFQVLKVKPGTIPICHFLPQDDVVWV